MYIYVCFRLYRVEVTCPTCDDGIVNSDSRLLLVANSDLYPPDDLEYDWSIYVIEDSVRVSFVERRRLAK